MKTIKRNYLGSILENYKIQRRRIKKKKGKRYQEKEKKEKQKL